MHGFRFMRYLIYLLNNTIILMRILRQVEIGVWWIGTKL